MRFLLLVSGPLFLGWGYLTLEHAAGCTFKQEINLNYRDDEIK
jgi:hypothetical protein